jgi:hypothetical protein
MGIWRRWCPMSSTWRRRWGAGTRAGRRLTGQSVVDWVEWVFVMWVDCADCACCALWADAPMHARTLTPPHITNQSIDQSINQCPSKRSTELVLDTINPPPTTPLSLTHTINPQQQPSLIHTLIHNQPNNISKELVLEVLPYLCLAVEWTLVGTSAYVTSLRKKVKLSLRGIGIELFIVCVYIWSMF